MDMYTNIERGLWPMAAVAAMLLAMDAVAQEQVLTVQTAHHAQVLRVSPEGDVNVSYFGKRLRTESDYADVETVYRLGTDYTGLYNAAYTPAGSRNLLEPAISVTHADGNNSLDLRYVRHELSDPGSGISLLKILLKDPVYPFEVTLYFKSYAAEDVVEQWTEISHRENGPVVLQKFASANLHIKGQSFWLRQYHGDWITEMQPEEARLTHGIKTLDSKLGTRANLFQPPVFMVSLENPATEDTGEVIFGALQWSGNFRTDFELDPLNNLRLISGINNYASAYTLEPGQVFTTPAFVYTYSAAGKGQASRNLHDWVRKHRLLDGYGERLTLLNNWEATYFDFNEQKLRALLGDTKKLGVDLFLLDDGWFANKYPRNGDVAGLGDWEENKEKLPNGIAALVSEATAKGVKFGIWIEPEMINPKSELYEKHPDWVIRQPNRAEYYFRNQLVLDLSNPRVQDFVFGVVDNLFTANPELAYIKWDCNAVIYNAYSAHLDNQSHLYIEYVRGLYRVLERIRDKYPTVPMMLCSGGGGRVDYAALQYFTEYWPSDNTDPFERIFMQWEYSYFYPAIASANHVTDWGKQPIKFRTDVAMMGKLGFDIVIGHLNEQDLQFCQQAVATYNDIKHTIWHGDQYRLTHPREAGAAAMLFLDKDKSEGVIFNYLVGNRQDEGSRHAIKIAGLDPLKTYRISEINGYPGVQSPIDSTKLYSGDFLGNVGFNPQVNRERTSVVLQLKEHK